MFTASFDETNSLNLVELGNVDKAHDFLSKNNNSLLPNFSTNSLVLDSGYETNYVNQQLQAIEANNNINSPNTTLDLLTGQSVATAISSQVAATGISATALPDLVITNITAPATIGIDNSFTLNYTFKNQGTAAAGSFYTYFYLSKDTTLSADDTYLNYDFNYYSIAAGLSSNESISLSVDNSNNNITEGTYYVLAQIDGDDYITVAESNENNNVKASAQVKLAFPDLVITNIAAPAKIAIGSDFTLNYTLKNQGIVEAGYSYTKFYLSQDTSFSNDDIYLDYDYNSSIAAGASSNESAYISVGNNIAQGTYYVLAQADGDKYITEKNEANNVKVSTAVTAAFADLVITNVTAPTTIGIGSDFTLNYTLKNQGIVEAGYSYTKFYLSKDTSLSNDDIYLDYDYNSSIAAGVSSNESVYLSISNSITPGTYYILAKADGDNSVSEKNENNNVKASVAVKTAFADLIITNVAAPATIGIGSSFTLNYTLKNQGTVGAGYSYTKFYLSKDLSLSNDDIYLDYDYNSSIAAGVSSNESVSLSVSNSIASGTYYVLTQADGDKYISEKNETNNVKASTAVTAAFADLIITNVAAPATIGIGNSLNFSYTLKNQGKAAVNTSHETKFYLSKDSTLSADDTYLDYDYIWSSLASQESVTESVSININAPTIGNYYILVQADGDKDVLESRENNNIAYAPISVVIDYSTYGYGLVNAAAAVAKALGQNPFPNVPNLGGNDWGADLIKAPEVWAKGYTGKGIVVAVLDTGVDRNHSDLKANIWKNSDEIAGDGIDNDQNGYIDDVFGWNFDENSKNTLDVDGHGTHVSGTIAGVKNNFGVTGIAYNAKIMPVKVLGDDGSGEESGVAAGIRYAVDNGANVINMSLGGSIDDPQMKAAVKYASSKGVIVVSAAGNDGGSQPHFPGYYATNWGLVAGAVDKYNHLADFSNRAGSNPIAYVTAPGVDVYSTTPNNEYDSYSGTSMASPHLAGVVALLLSAKKSLTDAQVRQIITNTAQFGSLSLNA